MVSAVSLIGAAFAVGGSYFAVDTLRDVLIAKTITMPYATRMAVASAAALGGLLVISNMAAQDARKQTKQNLGKQLMGAEDDDPNYMVRRDLHSLNESSIKMNVLLDEFPEVDLMPWWKSKLSVAANTTDNLADTLGHYISSPEEFDAEGYDHRKDGSWSRMVADTPTDTVMHQVDIFHDSFITDVDEAHRAAQRWLRKNENDRFDQIHYIIDMIDTGKWGMEYIALDTMDAEELTFHDWSDQEMMTHGKDDSFEDWVEHEIDSHGNLTLRDWADDEEESHIRRYGAETAYSMIEHQDDTCLKDIADSLRTQYGLGPINGFFEWDSDSDGNLTLGIYDDDNNRLDKIVYDRKALAKALKQVGYRNPESWGAEGTKVRRHSLDRFTKQRKPSSDSFRRKGRRSALRSMMAAEDNTVYMIETEYHSWDNWQNDCIAYDSFGPYATERGAKEALKEMMEDEAERWTQHDDLRDPDTNEPMFTFGLDLDEYGNLEIKPSGMSLGDFTQKHTKTEHKGGRAFDGMTYSGVVVAKQMKAADSDDDDDDTDLVPDREPSRGAPDLWFAERVFSATNFRQFTPQEALKYLRSGDNTVWLIDYSDYNYGDDEYPHYDYPIEDPDELETMIFEGVFEKGSPFYGTVIANGTSYDLDMWKDEPDGKHPSFVEWNAESSDYRQFTPQEAVEYLRSGANTLWLIDYADENYGDDKRPHYDYPVEDPEDLETIIADGVFDENTAPNGFVPTIANGTSYDLGLWDDEPGGIHPSFYESPDWMKGMDEDEYAAWANAWNSRSRGAFTDKDAEESINECGLKGRDCYACRGCGRCQDCTIVDGYSISSGDVYCVDCSEYRESKNAEVFEAFSISDRPVSVKFGPGTSGNAKMKATFTDASGDTKTTQFGYKGMSDFTKHKDEGRRDSYLARHGSKGQNQNWKDPTTAGALSRYVLWEKTSLQAAKSAFKKRFNLRAEETHARYSVADLGYQESIFLTDPGRRAVWDYETDYSVEDAE